MKTLNRASRQVLRGLSFGLLLMGPTAAFAGVQTVTPQETSPPVATCKTDDGRSLCPPQGVSEEVVPEYYDVPTVTQHIYYQKPEVKPVVTHIVHHVPTPVYGGKAVVERVEAGSWQGAPVASCCQQSVVHNPATVTITQQPVVHIVPRQPAVTYMQSDCRAWHHRPRPCR